jgi:hypothetical protein
MVVVTSRCQLTGLIAADGACPLPLDLLTTAEARALLARHLGPQRCASEPAAVAELIQLSGRLPLALSSASAQAAWQPHLSLAVLTERLRDPRRRLDALSAGDEAITLREALSWFYEQQERTRSPAG